MMGHGVDVLNAMVDEEDLPSPLKLSRHGLPDQFIIIPDHKG